MSDIKEHMFGVLYGDSENYYWTITFNETTPTMKIEIENSHNTKKKTVLNFCYEGITVDEVVSTCGMEKEKNFISDLDYLINSLIYERKNDA